MAEIIHPTCKSVTTKGAVAGVFGRQDGSGSSGFAVERRRVMMSKWFQYRLRMAIHQRSSMFSSDQTAEMAKPEIAMFTTEDRGSSQRKRTPAPLRFLRVPRALRGKIRHAQLVHANEQRNRAAIDVDFRIRVIRRSERVNRRLSKVG